MASPRHHDRGMGRADGQASDRGRRSNDTQKAFARGFRARRMLFKRACLAASAAHAADFSAEYVFGDSLSDVGNVYLATGGRSSRPALMSAASSATGRSGCRTWLARLGLPALTAEPGRRQRITPSAARRPDPPPRTIRRSPIWSNRSPRSLRAPRRRLRTRSTPSRSAPTICSRSSAGRRAASPAVQAAGAAAQVVADEAATLAAAGAKNLVLFDVPDLGITPGITALGPVASAAGHRPFGRFFDQRCCKDLAPVEAAGLTVYDLEHLRPDRRGGASNPGAFGFSNVTDPCWTGGFTGGARLALFHGPRGCRTPTFSGTTSIRPRRGMLLVADAALSALGLPVPEPSTWAMLLVGFGGLGFAGYRARARAGGVRRSGFEPGRPPRGGLSLSNPRTVFTKNRIRAIVFFMTDSDLTGPAEGEARASQGSIGASRHEGKFFIQTLVTH